MHTVEEAKGLWCPHARVDSEDGSHNRNVNGGLDLQTTKCVADKCAMWRWADEPIEVFPREYIYCDDSGVPQIREAEPDNRPEHVPASYIWRSYLRDGRTSGWVEPDEEFEARKPTEQAKRRGYCGRAGRP